MHASTGGFSFQLQRQLKQQQPLLLPPPLLRNGVAASANGLFKQLQLRRQHEGVPTASVFVTAASWGTVPTAAAAAAAAAAASGSFEAFKV